MNKLPRTAGLFYKPKLTFTKSTLAGQGRTKAAGDIVVGRDHYGNARKAAELVRVTVNHEKVHQFLSAVTSVPAHSLSWNHGRQTWLVTAKTADGGRSIQAQAVGKSGRLRITAIAVK